MLAAADRDRRPSRAVAQRRRHVRRVERRDRLRRQRHVLAEQRAERAVVRLHLVAAELLGGGDEAHAPDVQLLAHDLGQPFDRRALAPVGDDDRLAQRLADLDLGLAARAQAEPHGLARQRHRLLELLVALGSGLAGWEVAQVHARQLAVEVVVDLIGDERAERREQLRHGQQARAQRGERRRIAVPEAPPRAAHVPVGELVDELGDRPARGGRVVGVQALARPARAVPAVRDSAQRSRSSPAARRRRPRRRCAAPRHPPQRRSPADAWA